MSFNSRPGAGSAAANKAKGARAPRRNAVQERKDAILRVLRDDPTLSVMKFCEKAGVTHPTYYKYAAQDEQFAAAVANLTGGVKNKGGRPRKKPRKNARRDLESEEQRLERFTPPKDVQLPLQGSAYGDIPVPPFPEFCEQYLGFRLWEHQLQWYDILEGRPPRAMHTAMQYTPGDPDMLVVNTPPGHAKSTTITVAYVTWRIVSDPGTRVVIVSKTQRLAIQFLLTIKTFLTHPRYRAMQEAFAPPGGFAEDSASWRSDLIYVGDTVRDTQEKDPTVQAIGIGGQVYGARADLIVVDDAVDNLNAGDWEKQKHWLETEVLTRIPDGGKVIVVGTRLAAKDLYTHLLDPASYDLDAEEEPPWTYFAQPAILDDTGPPEQWVTLWPRCEKPSGKNIEPDEHGTYPKWTGPILHKRKRRMSTTAWQRVFQQQQVADDNTFDPELIHKAQTGYQAGMLPDSNHTFGVGRPNGMRGLRIIIGVDPASVGHTAMVAYGIDPADAHRWVLDCHNEQSMLPHRMKEQIKTWVNRYQASEVRVERNAFQAFLTRDIELKAWLANQGCSLSEHVTGTNKWDPGLGVSSMAALFEAELIHLPTSRKPAVADLVAQLKVWAPNAHRSVKDDLVMALWFAELRAAELIRHNTRSNNFDTGSDWFTPQFDIRRRHTVDALDAETQVAPYADIWGGGGFGQPRRTHP
jgi:hypothetical protein